MTGNYLILLFYNSQYKTASGLKLFSKKIVFLMLFPQNLKKNSTYGLRTPKK